MMTRFQTLPAISTCAPKLRPCSKVKEAHNTDVHTVDWSLLDEHMVVTGSADQTLRLWDRRKLGSTGRARHSSPPLP